jgi:hypothetical protein
MEKKKVKKEKKKKEPKLKIKGTFNEALSVLVSGNPTPMKKKKH